MIVLYGPTGVGKTDFSLLLASQIPVEIINMDVGSFYTPLTIGTCKPAWQQSAVVHHLFDIVDTAKNYSVAQYRTDVLALVSQIHGRGKMPLLVGGSGFYLKSLLFPPRAAGSSPMLQASTKSTADLWHELHTVDPKRAALIDKNDRYRIERAIAIWQETGQIPSSYAPTFDPIEKTYIVHITRERAQLYESINQRVISMFDQGWIDEVKNLMGSAWQPFLQEKKIIGYDDILKYLVSSETKIDSLIERIQIKTRNYAKRQETFWRMLQKQLASADPDCQHVQQETINLTLKNLDLYLKQLLPRITNF